MIPGRIRMNRAGKGFLQPDDSDLKEIAIAESATGTAMHEDRVLVRRDVGKIFVPATARRKPGRSSASWNANARRWSARCNAANNFFTSFQMTRAFRTTFMFPSREMLAGLRTSATKWSSSCANGNRATRIPKAKSLKSSVRRMRKAWTCFPFCANTTCRCIFQKPFWPRPNAIGKIVNPRDEAGRVDCRAHQVITIDPDDAKDFDDAICLGKISPEQWRLWVHIADVSRYVKPGTALDAEAQKRGNSTYLVDRVIPMLPEALSNELCSLKPNVDRLTKCVEFLVSNDGRVLNTKFYSAVIHSQKRFAYGEVLEILQRAPSEDPIEQMLHHAHELAQKIRRLRFKAGSLDLDFPETKIRLDEHGKILRIEKNENDVSHQLIEEYMLLANEAVATRLMTLRTPAIYRIHEEPDARRLQEYRDEVLAHHVACGNLSQTSEVQKLLQKLGTLPIGQALKIGFLKSLMRARYAVEPLGHYGLAKKKYTHFTSPIRRYADLVVHRALFDKNSGSASALKEIAEHISVTERNSADAERDSKDVKLFAFLNAQLASGEPVKYPALVTDVRNFGFFVDVSGLAMSGLVPLSTTEDDFYVFDESRNHLVGRRTRRMIRLGDKPTVQVAKVDTFKKQVDFCLVEDHKPATRSATRGNFTKSPVGRWNGPPRGSQPRPAQGRRHRR